MPADPQQVHWFIRNLRHTKGKWTGKPFNVLPWQDDLISSLFELNPDGSRAKRRAYIQCGRKAGKCSSPDSPVPTPDGWRTIGDLAVGDRVFAVDGTPTTVTAIGTWTDRPMWRLHFNDETTADADENHEWPVYFSPGVRNRPNRSTRWIVDRLNSSSSGVSLVQNAAVQFPEADLPIHPYVLGVWLGDGSRHFGSITSMDWDEFAPAIESLGYELLPVQPSSVREGNRATNRTISGLSAALRDEGLLLNKHIPDAYLTASVGQRLDLLAGIIDTDGYVSKSNDRTPVVEITLCHERLANDVLALTRSLGFRPLFRRQECPEATCGWKWTISFYAERSELPLRLTRKLDRLPATINGRGRRHHVVRCERLPDGPSISIEIDHPSHVFLVGDGYVPTHNSEIGAAIGLALLVCDKEPGGEVIIGAGKRDQARIMLDVAKRMVRYSKINGTPLEKFLVLRQDGIYFEELDAVLKVISADGEKEHGANPHAVIMDELHVLGAKRDLWDAMETAQGARENPLLISFTTPGPAPIGIAYDEYRYARQVMAGVINDPTFLPVIFEADRDLDIDNPEAWRQANPSYPITPNEEWMEARAKAVLDGRAPEYVFRRLQLGQWCTTPDTIVTLADGSWVRVRDLFPGDVVLAFDESSGSFEGREVSNVAHMAPSTIYRVETKRGHIIRTNSEHPFWVRDADTKKFHRDGGRWVKARDLTTDMMIRQGVTPVVENHSRWEDGWILGAWLGDGSWATPASTPSIAVTKGHGVAERFIDLAARRGWDAVWADDRHIRVKGDGLRNFLSEWFPHGSYSASKEIPERIDPSMLAGIIAGLCDTDGWCSPDHLVAVCSISEAMLQTVQVALGSLGIVGSIRHTHTYGSPAGSVAVRDSDSIDVFKRVVAPLMAHNVKRERILGLETKRSSRRNVSRFQWTRIASVETEDQAPTIGVEVVGLHTHITNGLVTHNTSALERWLPRAKWEACGGPAVIPDGADVWVGIDAALKRDSFGVSLLYVERGWTEDENGLSIPADIGHLKVWAFVPTEEGEYIDQEDVRTHIMGLAARYNIQKVSYDPAYMTLFAQQLEGSGLPIEPFPQSPERMMKATETFQRVVLNERLRHGNDRTIDEQVASLGIRESDRGVRISKSRSGGRIDAISAAVMCIEEAFGGEDEPQDFFYMD